MGPIKVIELIVAKSISRILSGVEEIRRVRVTTRHCIIHHRRIDTDQDRPVTALSLVPCHSNSRTY